MILKGELMGTNWFFDMLGIVLATIFAVEYGKYAVKRYKRERYVKNFDKAMKRYKDVDMKSHTKLGEIDGKSNSRNRKIQS